MANDAAAVNRDIVQSIERLIIKLKPNNVIIDYIYRNYGVSFSVRTLQRRMKDNGLRRYDGEVTPQQLTQAIQNEVTGCRADSGYRKMTLRVRLKHGLLVTRQQVYEIMNLMGLCKSRLFMGVGKPRQYYSKGPNWVWHVDQYNKLRHYGFGIHGCVDGFSRCVIWLRIYSTNRDPWIVAKYFYEVFNELQVVPATVRVDRGTENCMLAECQVFLRRNHQDALLGIRSLTYGKSKLNQRVECWWSQLRWHWSGFWIDFFKELEASGYFDKDNFIHRGCLYFVFMPFLEELKEVMHEHNTYCIRKQKDCLCPPGVPEDNFLFPERKGFSQQGYGIHLDELTPLIERHGFDMPIPDYLTPEFRQFLEQQLAIFLGTTVISSVVECKESYLHLVDLCSHNSKFATTSIT